MKASGLVMDPKTLAEALLLPLAGLVTQELCLQEVWRAVNSCICSQATKGQSDRKEEIGSILLTAAFSELAPQIQTIYCSAALSSSSPSWNAQSLASAQMGFPSLATSSLSLVWSDEVYTGKGS